MLKSAIDKTTSLILGSLIGVSLLFVLTGFNVIEEDPNKTTIFAFGLLGILIVTTFLEIKKEQTIQKHSKIRNETIALITHEMKTSLTSTSWLLELILQNYGQYLNNEDRTMMKDSVGSIHATVMHSLNLLDISLLDINKLVIALEWVTLDKIEQMFKETLDKYALGAKKHNIVLRTNISLSKEKMVEVDMIRLRIILENLLENAIQYCSEIAPEISIEIKNDDKNILISVKDNGMGIPEKEQENIFNEFFRATNARKKLSTGSGIGLYMTSEYVKAHKGTISFISKEGVGTTFIVSIPLKTSEDVKKFLAKI